MLDNISKYSVILGSNSPRRRMLLQGLNLPFTVRTVEEMEESYPENLKGEEIPVHIAKNKAAAYMPTLGEDELLITADTIVWVEGKMLGKPAGRSGAIQMLHTLSGRTHEVITGVCLTTNSKQLIFSVTSEVSFAKLSASDIEHYVDNYHPFDKAGAYGIQEWIGYIGVESIKGSFYNVMGLPVQRVYRELASF